MKKASNKKSQLIVNNYLRYNSAKGNCYHDINSYCIYRFTHPKVILDNLIQKSGDI